MEYHEAIKNDAHIYLLTWLNTKYNWVKKQITMKCTVFIYRNKSNMGWKYYLWVRGEGDFHFWAYCERVRVQTRSQQAVFGGPFQTTGKLWSYKAVQEALKGPGLEFWLWQERGSMQIQTWPPGGSREPSSTVSKATFNWEGFTPEVWCRNVGVVVSGQCRNTDRDRPWVHTLSLCSFTG